MLVVVVVIIMNKFNHRKIQFTIAAIRLKSKN